MKSSTKYAEIYSYLLDYIKKNELKNGDKLPTENQLADQFGASRVTVRRAIKELSDRQIVYKIQGGGTYVGSVNMTQHNSVDIIPFVISNNVNSFALIVQGAENYLSQHSCYLTMHCSNGDCMAERNIITSLVEKGSQSIIVLPCSCDKNRAFYFDLIQRGVNLIFVDLKPHDITCNYVSTNNFLGGYTATKYLLDKGYRRIAIFSDNTDTYNTMQERVNGYKFALAQAGIPLVPDYMPDFDRIVGEIPIIISKLMTSPTPPDAFFAANDIIAINTLVSLQRHGYRVPDDAAIIGFDNLDANLIQSVPLSTIEQNFYEIGRIAAEMSLMHINHPTRDFLCHSIPGKLIERDSTRLHAKPAP